MNEDIERMIDGYNDLRERCLALAKEAGGERMGHDAWLRYALREDDITLRYTVDGIQCSGHAFTTQTQSNEWFCFTILWADLTGEGVRLGV